MKDFVRERGQMLISHCHTNLKKFFFQLQWIYNIILVSGVQHSD